MPAGGNRRASEAFSRRKGAERSAARSRTRLPPAHGGSGYRGPKPDAVTPRLTEDPVTAAQSRTRLPEAQGGGGHRPKEEAVLCHPIRFRVTRVVPRARAQQGGAGGHEKQGSRCRDREWSTRGGGHCL